jgi:uncharacterized protein YcgI (DUF1989 family)
MSEKSERIITSIHLQPRTGTAFSIAAGEVVRILDVAGEQVVDLVSFAQENTSEYLSSGRSVDYNNKIYLTTGDVLYSDRSNPMFTIVDDTVGKHDFLFAPCSPEMFRRTYGVEKPHPNCLDNLAAGLAPFGISPSNIPVAFNVFMNAGILPDGAIIIAPPLSMAGDFIDLRAEMDLVVAVSACSAKKCNNYKNTPIDVIVFSGEKSGE